MKIKRVHYIRHAAAALSAALLLPTSQAWAQSAGQWGSAEKIYGKVCSYCHETAVAPRLFGRDLSPQYVRLVVLQGLRAMPAFRPTDFSEEELAAVGNLVQTLAGPWKSNPRRGTAAQTEGGRP